MPNHFKIYKGFVANLEKIGFSIELVFTSDQDFRYENFSQKVYNFLKKTFLGDRDYKAKLQSSHDDRSLAKTLLKIETKVDYALVIRADYFSKETLCLLKNKTNQLVAYQWDGLDRYPKVKNLIEIFDRFFLFDADDFVKYKSIYPNVFQSHNFYFDFEFPTKVNNIEKSQKEVFFVGSFIENRIKDIIYIAKIFDDLDFQLNINLLYFEESTPEKYKHCGINFIDQPLSYLEVLEEVKNADVILDFADTVHNGLSFRIFETLRFSKKLITNNPLVRKYDFYSPNNILIWEQSLDQTEIKEFLKEDYKKLDETILQKYSFTNWIGHIINQ